MVRPSSLALSRHPLSFITIYYNRRKLGLILYERYSELLIFVAIELDSILRRPFRNLMCGLLGTTVVLRRPRIRATEVTSVARLAFVSSTYLHTLAKLSTSKSFISTRNNHGQYTV